MNSRATASTSVCGTDNGKAAVADPNGRKELSLGTREGVRCQSGAARDWRE